MPQFVSSFAVLRDLGRPDFAFAVCHCVRKQTAAKPLPIDEVPKTIQNAFKESTPEVSNVVSEVVTSVHQDQGKTLEELQTLSEQPNLTAEQRRATERAMYSVLNKLSQSAAKA